VSKTDGRPLIIASGTYCKVSQSGCVKNEEGSPRRRRYYLPDSNDVPDPAHWRTPPLVARKVLRNASYMRPFPPRQITSHR
jgi:hypothetical protein